MSDSEPQIRHHREERYLPRDNHSPSHFDLDRLRQVITEKDAENARLRGEVTRLNEEAARLDRQLSRSLKLNEKLEAEIERLSSNADSNDDSAAKAQLHKEFSKTSVELNKCQQHNTSLESQLKEHKDQIKDLTQQLGAAKSQEAEKVQISGKLDKALKEIYYWRCVDRMNIVSKAALQKHTGYASDFYVSSPRYNLTKDGKEVYGVPFRDVINDIPHLVRDYGLEHLATAIVGVYNNRGSDKLGDDFNWEMRDKFLELLNYKDPSHN